MEGERAAQLCAPRPWESNQHNRESGRQQAGERIGARRKEGRSQAAGLSCCAGATTAPAAAVLCTLHWSEGDERRSLTLGAAACTPPHSRWAVVAARCVIIASMRRKDRRGQCAGVACRAGLQEWLDRLFLKWISCPCLLPLRPLYPAHIIPSAHPLTWIAISNSDAVASVAGKGRGVTPLSRFRLALPVAIPVRRRQ